MKRLIVVLSCLSIFYAGAVWALEGCLDFGTDAHGAHHGEKSAHDPHTAGAGAHHSHTDPSKIHCPNVLGEFLISAQATPPSDHRHAPRVAQDARAIGGALLSDSAGLFEGDGPPGTIRSRIFHRHLLLSVIRI